MFIPFLTFIQVALKILVIIHRGLREVDPTFHEDFTNYNFNKFHVLNLSHFKDDSSPGGIWLFFNLFQIQIALR